MSLPDFQRALARLIAAPEVCEETIIDDAPFFAGYDLTEREKTRLRSVLRQKGISACCSLYRMNRITPVYTQLSNSAILLGDAFVPLVTAFWRQLPDTTLQFRDEVLLFGNYLHEQLATGALVLPYLKEVLQLELAINGLSYLPGDGAQLLCFDHDITGILQCLREGTLGQTAIPSSSQQYRLSMAGGELQLEPV